jgi:dolichyl-phosphate beta-glucosyltransferase
MPEAITVVIPTFNEERRIIGTLRTVTAYLQARAWSAEIIVSDDGSQDGTCGAVEHLMTDDLPVRLLRSPRNLGKGSAVRQGVLASRSPLVLVSDADLATPIEEAGTLLKRLDAGADIAIGSRGLRDSQIQVRQPLPRELLGRTFNLLVQLSVVPSIWDTQCGFKLFRGSVARRLFALSRIDGFAFDVEILGLARRLGYVIAEVPVRWQHVGESKVHVGRAGVRMLADLVRIVRRLHVDVNLASDALAATAAAAGDGAAMDPPEPGSASGGR